MWQPKGNGVKKTGGNGLIAVAVDKDKSSQHALKWAVDNLLNRGQTVVLIHVAQRTSISSVSSNWSCWFNFSLKLLNLMNVVHFISCFLLFPLLGAGQSQVYDASATTNPHQKQPDKQIRDLFLTFRCYSTRKDVCFLALFSVSFIHGLPICIALI